MQGYQQEQNIAVNSFLRNLIDIQVPRVTDYGIHLSNVSVILFKINRPDLA